MKRKAEGEAAATGTTMPDDLYLRVIVAGGMRRRRLYRAGSEVVHLKLGAVKPHLVED